MPTETPAEVIGRRYIIQNLIGEGGMGAVYRATDRLTDHAVALKRVLTAPAQLELSTNYNLDDFRLALAREFKILASLRHPHIIAVQDYGFDAGQQPYFTMELLDEAQTILDAGRGKSPETKVNLLVQVLQALAYLHRRDILHRDLKPANVLVTQDNSVKMLDFGLATMRERVHNETDSLTAGTLLYMAPEILVGNAATEASDLYAVGIMAFELLAGYPPFANTGDVAQLINDTLYTFPDTEALDITYDLKLVLDRLLQKDPLMRYSSAMEAVSAMSAGIGRPIQIDTEATRESFLQAARFVGRNTELKQLTDALEKAVNGTGSAWLIAGESGVGKSRLLEELRTVALVEGALVMRGQAVNEGGSPYQMWRTPARWLELMTEDGTVELNALRGLLPAGESPLQKPNTLGKLKPKEAQDKLLSIFAETLRSQQHPIMLILEDLHWASSESLDLLGRMVEMVNTLPLLIIGSYRDDESASLPTRLPKMPILKLNRLSDEGIAQLSEAMLGEAGKQQHVIDLLKRETEGNIFFLIEVVRTLAEEAGELDEIGRMTLPQHVFAGGVKQLIERRLNNILPSNRELLRIAAAMGRELDIAVLRAIAPQIDMERWLLNCADAAVLEIFDEQWRFVHDKLRDGILVDVDAEGKAAIHRQIAVAIEQVHTGRNAQPAALAYHWGQAGDTAKELYYVEHAGKQAVAVGAYHEAIKFLRRALLLIERQKGDNRDKIAHIRQQIAEAQLGLGGYEEAQALYNESLAIYRALNLRSNIADVLNNLGDIAYAQDKYDEAKQLYEQGLAIYREIGDMAGIARSLHDLGNVAYELDEQQEARRLYQESLNISREIGDQWGMAGASAKIETLAETADAPSSSQYIQKRRVLLAQVIAYQQSDDPRRLSDAFFSMGDLALKAGRHADAVQDYRKCLALRKTLDDPIKVLEVQERLGAAYLAMEDTEKAWYYLREALAMGRYAKARGLLLDVLYDIAELSNMNGNKARAMQLLAFVLNHPESSEALEDRAERLSFALEAELDDVILERAWERGKNVRLDSIIEELMIVEA